MQEKFTQLVDVNSSFSDENIKPREATVNFIKQFARVYTVITPELGGFTAN